MRPSIAVIIPAYNEAKTIATVIKGVAKLSVPVIVVNDGSDDETEKLALKSTKHVITHAVNLGKGAAMKTGAEYAFDRLGVEAIIFLDGDGQHHSKELPNFISELTSGEEIVFGVRSLDQGMPFDRVIGNRLVSLATKALFGGPYMPDILSGYKAFSKRAYQQLIWEASGYEVELEIAARTSLAGLSYKNIPIQTVYVNLQRGMNILDSFSVVTHLLTLRLRLGILKG